MSVASALKVQRAINLRRGARLAGSLSTLVAADFLTGGSPVTAEAYDRKGVKIEAFARRKDETLLAFRERVREAARALSGAARVKIGGFAGGPSAACAGLPEGVPGGAIVLPDIPPHTSQLAALDLIRNHRRAALVCGRRWGKTSLLTMLAVDAALAGKSVGVFCPTYKFLGPLFEPIVSALRALPDVRVNRMLGELRLEGGGAIDFWSLDYTARAGRGRRYHLALIDESAHDEGRLADSFPASIAPALLDFNGAVVTASTPNGLDGWFHDIVHDQRHGFAAFHAPTSANPHLPVEAIAALRAELPRPEVASQELDAMFVDTGGATIFPLALLLDRTASRTPTTSRARRSGWRSTATAARAAPIATAARRDLRRDHAGLRGAARSRARVRAVGLGHSIPGARRDCALAQHDARAHDGLVPALEAARRAAGGAYRAGRQRLCDDRGGEGARAAPARDRAPST